MLLQAVVCLEDVLKLAHIQIDWFTILCLDVYVLPFNLSGLFPRKVRRRMWERKIERNDLVSDCRLNQRRSDLSAVSNVVSWIEARLFLGFTTLLNQVWADVTTIFTCHFKVSLVDQDLRCNYRPFLEGDYHRARVEISSAWSLLQRLL